MLQNYRDSQESITDSLFSLVASDFTQVHREIYDHLLRNFTKKLCQSNPVLCRASVLQCLEERETAPDLLPRFSEALFALTVPHRHCRGYSRQWWLAEESLRLSLRYFGLVLVISKTCFEILGSLNWKCFPGEDNSTWKSFLAIIRSPLANAGNVGRRQRFVCRSGC